MNGDQASFGFIDRDQLDLQVAGGFSLFPMGAKLFVERMSMRVFTCGDFCYFRLRLQKSEDILVFVGPHRRIDSSLFRLIRFGLIVGILADLPSIAFVD